MSESIIVRCPKCQQRLKVVPLAGPSQVKCPHCATTLKIAGASKGAATPANPALPKIGLGDPLQPPTSRTDSPGNTASSVFPDSGFPAAGFSPKGFSDTSGGQPPMLQVSQTCGPVNPVGPGNPVVNGKPKKTGIPHWVFWLIGTIVGVPILCCGTLSLMFVFMKKPSGRPVVPIAVTLKACPTPNLITPRGEPERVYSSGIQTYFVRGNGSPEVPGMRMQYRIFVPAGEHEPASLPCVLVSPAGTPLIHGASLEPGSDYDAETLPYAEAGFVVVRYSIDGPLSEGADAMGEDENLKALMSAYPRFRDSGAGVVNGRNAIHYALTLPYVDSRRIYSAGHSSAGCLSLLLAAHDSRIRGCVAYAAAYDLETRMEELTSNFFMKQMLPEVDRFIIESSPSNHIDQFQCPVFIFHAKDDSNVPFSDATKFVDRMKSAGKEVKLEISDSGDHYQSMIDPGIPKAIQWMQEEGGS